MTEQLPIFAVTSDFWLDTTEATQLSIDRAYDGLGNSLPP